MSLYSDLNEVLTPYAQKIKELAADIPDGLKYENNVLYLTSDDVIVGDGVEILAGGGSGGGSSNDAVLSVTNTTGWLAATVSQPVCSLSFNWSSLEDDTPTGDGMLIVRINNVQKVSRSISQGEVIADIGQYLISGTNNVKLTVSDVYGNSRTINYTVNYYSYVLSSTFDRTQIFTSSITYYYVATGSGTKVMHFKLDGTEIGSEIVTSSGKQNNYVIGTLTNGPHTLEVYFTVTVNENSIESNHLFYDLIYAGPGSAGTYIAASYNDLTVDQYSTCLIPYIVYDPESSTVDVVLSVNGSAVSSLINIDRNEHYWSYKAVTPGTVVLTITSGGTTKTITLTVNESDIDVHAETQDLALYLSSSGRSNNEADPGTWSYGLCSAEFSDFLYDSDGWQLDSDGNTCLRIRGLARLYIPHQIFANDFTRTGKTIEFEFATSGTFDAGTAVISCISGGIGFVVTPQRATLYSALSSVSTVFKEDEHVRISFVINKAGDNRLVLIYINGIVSGCIQYSDLDTFQQADPVGISIGSNDATIDLYAIRIYDNNLTRYQILDNWIADTQNVDEMVDRYNRNNIYDEYYEITISRLPANLPYMIINGAALPEYKGDKKTVSIEFTDPTGEHPDFTAENVQIDVQGTSSAGYARKNFKCKFKNGFVINGASVNGYQMARDSIATSTFTFKADVASSEGANNVELVRLYNDYAPYQTEPQESNSMIRQGIDGFPMVIFHNDGETTQFVGKYNFNNDKGTPEVYGFETGDESWEIKNNTDALALFSSDDFTNWANTFEGRYPDGNTVITNLRNFVSWVYSTDASAATNEAIPEPVTYDGTTYTSDTAAYRLAKFKAELSNHANVTALAYYYIFTELFLMIDSRAKNAFPSFFGDGKWLILPYDFDTAIGINNEGELSFGPYLEDTDTLNGADVFNGQNSVLWVNFRSEFADTIKTVYNTARTAGISYAEVESRFERHQGRWPEAIFNEDAQYKYIDPLVNPANGHQATAEYLPMLLGSKEQQRKWWLYSRFRYMDNRYEADAITLSSNRIYFRANAVANLTLTPAYDTYLVAKYGSAQVKNKAAKGVPTTMVCPLSNMNDTECYIYGCENIKDLGDMAALNVSNITVSQAKNLQYLKLGDAVLQNTKLTSIDLSGCTKLRKVDLRNCINLTGVVDVSNCYMLEELYLTGTQVTAVKLPYGGVVKKLHLPEVVAIEVINNPHITEFVYDGDYSSIKSLHLDNVGCIPETDIILGMDKGSRVRLTNINWTFGHSKDLYPVYHKLRVLGGLDEHGNNTRSAYISGEIQVDTCHAALRSCFIKWFSDVSVGYNSEIPQSSAEVSSDQLSSALSTLVGSDFKTTITKIVFATAYTPDGSESSNVTINDGSYPTILYLKNNTEVYIANNNLGYVNVNTAFNDFTSLRYLDLTGELHSSHMFQNRFLNTSSLDTLLGFEYAEISSGGTTSWYTNMFKGCGIGSLDLSPFYNKDPQFYISFMNMPNIEILDLSALGTKNGSQEYAMVSNMPKLRSCVSLKLNGTIGPGTFGGCPLLTHCIFETDTGITHSNNALKGAPFDYASIASYINCLVDTSDSPVTITLHTATFAVLDEVIIAAATSKGYTLASA